MPLDIPSYDADLLSEEVLSDPSGHYREIRDLGPVVWLPRNAMVRHVERIDVDTPKQKFNNLLHGYAHMTSRFQ